MRILLLLSFILPLFHTITSGQVILSEDFESGSLPTGWSISSNATDGGWNIGSVGAVSSQSFTIPDNGSGSIAATNDDACNCDKAQDILISPAMDLSGVTIAVVEMDVVFLDNAYQGIPEDAFILVSIDGGATWEKILEVPGNSGWNRVSADLSSFAGQENVQVGIEYSDNGGWLYGMAVDNITVSVPPQLDAGLESLSSKPFGETAVPFPISGTIVNFGATPIESLTLTYQIDGGIEVTEQINNLSIPPFSQASVSHPTPWIPDAEGVFEITVSISAVNGQTDEVDANNSLTVETEIFPGTIVPNRIAEFLAAEPVITPIATSADNLDKPTDLDFFPILSKRELWVINERTANTGGSTVTFFDAGTAEQDAWYRVDGNAWHFMSLPTALAFGDNGFWASSPGVLDANHSGGTFTGPTLWSSDPEIYAQPSGGNGSHMDMLHGSPYSMGIAHEVDNVYWVFDGYNETLVRYDFVEDHGPGNADHSDAIVRRYLEISVKKDGDVPSHLILDKSTGWMYVVDNGNDRVLRVDINSGEIVDNLPLINEPLAEHSEVGNVDWEVIIDQDLQRPCGIDLIENRLLVGDYETGEIIIYDMDNGFVELGRLQTGAPGLTGIRVGPEGNIWYTNRLENTVNLMSPGSITSIDELSVGTFRIAPNPTAGFLQINLAEMPAEKVLLQLFNASGQLLLTDRFQSAKHELSLEQLPAGVYQLQLEYNGKSHNEQVVISR